MQIVFGPASLLLVSLSGCDLRLNRSILMFFRRDRKDSTFFRKLKRGRESKKKQSDTRENNVRKKILKDKKKKDWNKSKRPLPLLLQVKKLLMKLNRKMYVVFFSNAASFLRSVLLVV